MARSVGIVFSNIHDKEVNELTEKRTLASVPFGGRYRLIDFVLSNMVNSGITNVGVITKYNYQSLMNHVGSGKSWDLSRKNGGLTLLPPFGNNDSSKVYSSRFEAISNVAYYLRERTEKYVVMSDCDNVCTIDFTEVVDCNCFLTVFALQLKFHILFDAGFTNDRIIGIICILS